MLSNDRDGSRRRTLGRLTRVTRAGLIIAALLCGSLATAAPASAVATGRTHVIFGSGRSKATTTDGGSVTIVKGTTGTSCSGYYSDSTPPATIRVLIYGSQDGNGLGSNPTGVVTVPFKDYVKNVLPKEWVSSWHTEALKSGAVAAKTYAWYWVNHYGGYLTSSSGTKTCFDVTNDIRFQVYADQSNQPSTDAAVDATWNATMTKDGHIFQAFFQGDLGPQGVPESCGAYLDSNPANRMTLSQYGSESCAAPPNNYSYQQILQTYYNGIAIATPVASHPATVGTARLVNGAWQFLETAQTGVSVHSGDLSQWVAFGNKFDTPLVGDWDGNGSKTAGFAEIVNGNWRFFGSNIIGTNASGHAGKLAVWQDWPNTLPSDVPLVGDWDGNGTDTPGFARKIDKVWRFYMTNNTGLTNHTAKLDQWEDFGYADTDVPLVGDWDGNHTDTPGTARPVNTTWQFLETNNTGLSDHHGDMQQWLNFGYAGTDYTDTPLVGDWDGNGTDTPGTARPVNTTWQFLETNNPGTATHTGELNQWLTFGYAPTDTPITGRWS